MKPSKLPQASLGVSRSGLYSSQARQVLRHRLRESNKILRAYAADKHSRIPALAGRAQRKLKETKAAEKYQRRIMQIFLLIFQDFQQSMRGFIEEHNPRFFPHKILQDGKEGVPGFKNTPYAIMYYYWYLYGHIVYQYNLLGGRKHFPQNTSGSTPYPSKRDSGRDAPKSIKTWKITCAGYWACRLNACERLR